jgi:ribosomal protein S18 acetylase RimI-like enzyme
VTVTGLRAELAARRPSPDDAPGVLDLVVACDVAAVGESDVTLAQVAADLASSSYDRERCGWLVLDGTGRTVGWLWSEEAAADGEVFLDPYSLDGAVLAWLFGQGLAYARSLAGERGRPLVVRAGAYEHDPLMTAVLTASPLRPVRRFFRMTVRLGPEHDDPPASGGVVVRPVADTDRERRLLHRVVTEAFRDHWESHERDYDEWRSRLDAQAGRDPSQWWLATVGGEPAGALIGDDAEADRGVGIVRTLGVLRDFRGRGVARALLRTAFAQARRRGRTSVALFVDSESPTGATRLYESVGMSVDKVLVSWRGEVAPP